MTFASNYSQETLITTHLEMTSRSQFRPAFLDRTDIEIVKMDTPDVSFYRFLYSEVGGEWCWRDRLEMSKSELYDILASANTEVHVLFVNGSPAGYVELSKQDHDVEIAYFGLRSAYHGMGLGKHLLSYGIEKAWDMGSSRLHLHTCNLDGEHALRNYQKRGFNVFMTEHEAMPELYL